MTKPSITKQKILQAAVLVVKEKGASQLTLEAVAKQAGISKGGLLYHYPNKFALLKAMVIHLNENCERAIEQRVKTGTSWLEAYVILSFDPEHSQIKESAGMLAAVANDMSLLEPLAERYRVLHEQLEANVTDPDLASIVRLAADGLWFNELFNISPLSEERRSQILKALLTLIKQDNANRSETD